MSKGIKFCPKCGSEDVLAVGYQLAGDKCLSCGTILSGFPIKTKIRQRKSKK